MTIQHERREILMIATGVIRVTSSSLIEELA